MRSCAIRWILSGDRRRLSAALTASVYGELATDQGANNGSQAAMPHLCSADKPYELDPAPQRVQYRIGANRIEGMPQPPFLRQLVNCLPTWPGRNSFRRGNIGSWKRFEAPSQSTNGQEVLGKLQTMFSKRRIELLYFERDVNICHRRIVSDALLGANPALTIERL